MKLQSMRINPLGMCEYSHKSYKIALRPSLYQEILLSDNYTLVVCDPGTRHIAVHAQSAVYVVAIIRMRIILAATRILSTHNW